MLREKLIPGQDQYWVVRAFILPIVLPRAVVVDVGFVADCGWAVIEFNAVWGPGLNGCNAPKVLPAILAASGAQPERLKT